MTPTKTFDMRSAARTMCLSLGVAAALWLLGRGALSTPPIDSWTRFQRWLGERSTAEAAIASLRATAMVGACYLGIVSVLTIVTSIAPLGHLEQMTRSLLPRSLRPLIGLAVGAGVVTAAASVSVPRDSASTRVATITLEAPTDATATMYFVTEPVAATSTVSTVTSNTAPATTLAPPLVAAPEPPPPAAVTTPASAITTTPPTWTIARGEHLWGVAAETLADSWQRAPTDAEVASYWHQLIETNRSRLIDSTNADYVLAGQTFVLPEVPPAPAK